MTTPPEAAPMREDVTHEGDLVTLKIMSDTQADAWCHDNCDDLETMLVAKGLLQRLGLVKSALAHTARPDAWDEVERVADRILAEVETFLIQQGGFSAYAERALTGKATGWSRLRSVIWLAALAAMREGVDRGMVERTEVQAVWRCAIGDMVGAMDILKNQWLESRRKAERQAGEVLSGVLDLIWAYRDPAPSSYEQANENGKALADRVRAALSGKVEP